MSGIILVDKNGQEEQAPNDWNALSLQAQNALIEWYNIDVNDIDYNDLQKLADLFTNGDFVFGECGFCGKQYHKAICDDWSQFQGVNEIDSVGEVCAECYAKAQTIMEMAES